MIKVYDRNGQAMTMEEWSIKMEDNDYKVIKQEEVGEYWISTVWLGLDHSFDGGDPLIFETMVFQKKKKWQAPSKLLPQGFWYRPDIDQRRYSTLTEAIIGHEKMVKLYAN